MGFDLFEKYRRNGNEHKTCTQTPANGNLLLLLLLLPPIDKNTHTQKNKKCKR